MSISSFPLRGYAGAASTGTLASPGFNVSAGAGTTFTSSTTLTGWTDVAGDSFVGKDLVISFGYGTSTEEKILCTFNPGTNTFTIVQRGYEGTTAKTQTTGNTFNLVACATEFAENNAVAQSVGPLIVSGKAPTAPNPIVYNATVPSTAGGSSSYPAAANHFHNIPASELNSWLAADASGAVASGVTVPWGQVTSKPTIPVVQTADQKTSTTALTINTTTYATSGTVLGTAVNPSGNFTTYRYSIMGKTLNSAASVALSLTLQLLYRVAGSGGAWTAVATAFGSGGANTTQTAYNFSYEGLWTAPSPTTDYEFQIGALTTTGTIQVDRWSLLVQGIN